MLPSASFRHHNKHEVAFWGKLENLKGIKFDKSQSVPLNRCRTQNMNSYIHKELHIKPDQDTSGLLAVIEI